MPPPPPPPRASIGNSSSSSGGGYYSSNAGQSSSTATRNRLGLNKNSRTATANNNQGGGMSSDDWFASNNNNNAAPAAPAPSSGSGFYSSNTAAPSNDMHSNNNYGANNSYGNNNNTISAAGSSSTGYYGGGGTSTTTTNSGYGQTHNTAMSGAIGSGNIPPPSAFGSNPNSGSFETMNNTIRNGSAGNTNSYEMSGQMGGPIGGGSSQQQISTTQPNVFDPNAAAAAKKDNNIPAPQYEEDYENEPPLLEELGVNFPHIYSKSRAVLFPFGKHAKSLESGLIENDADLAGPLAFALGLGGELLLSGKMHFGYVYGFGMSGCLAMTLLLNLLNPNGAVSMWTVVSILGYALLPVNLLAGMNVLLRVHKLGIWGMVLAVLTIVWCTTASARLFERGCNMRAQRFLVAYPTALLYSAFVMITIF